MNIRRYLIIVFVAACFFVSKTCAQDASITTPKEQLGHNLGDDYFLANYTQLVDYWQKLERESDRLKLEVIGKTEEGRDMLMAIITSPANHENLERYKEIARKMAQAEGLHDDEARVLAKEGKAVVWIDGGLHATEVLVAQQLMETVYQLCALNDQETLRFLNDVIVLCANPNPDGQELVANWYMRHEDEKKRSARGIPRLYQKYIGHDNNRDFYMVSMKETEAICRVFYHEWFPQIVFNHHQTGPSGTVLFAPPFRGPFNHNFDPLVPLGINSVGAAIHSRFAVEGKPGATMKKGASYSTWWNGGLRTNTYFHNMIGLLTETIGSPAPMEIPLRTGRLLPNDNLPYPITPQKWHFRQSLDYSVCSNRAVLDYASRNREHMLFNIYRMGKNSIDRGNRDHWTIRPKQVAAAEYEMYEREDGGDDPITRRDPGSVAASSGPSGGQNANESPSNDKTPTLFEQLFRGADHRDPRAYVISSEQRDFLTATKFVNALIKNGITVHRATEWFEAAGEKYPPDSYVVKTAQAFRPHVIDMFEPQDHPDDIPYTGGPPNPPYDSAGWTLAYQMGVKFDRILDGFDGPFQRITGLIEPEPGTVTRSDDAKGFLLSHATNDSFLAINRLLKSGERVEWYTQPIKAAGTEYPVGTMYVPKSGSTLSSLEQIADEIGLDFAGVTEKPEGAVIPLRQVRIGLWDRYGGSMASGWVRWLLEQFEFDFRQVFPKELDEGDLNSKFEVLVFVGGSIPRAGGDTGGRRRFRGRTPKPEDIPEEYHDWLGSVTVDKTIPKLKEFLEQGGTILTIGSATSLASHLELPLENPLLEKKEDGSIGRIGREKYYIPGSVLKVRVNNQEPLAYGMEEHTDIYFNNSPVFRLLPEATIRGVRPIAWFDSEKPLRSGWAWGQDYLKNTVAVAQAKVGKGHLFLFGPEITYRSQPHASFKFLFNGIYYGPAVAEE